MKRTIFYRRLTVFINFGVEFSSCQEALFKAFPSALVESIARNQNDLLKPQPIDVAPQIGDGEPWKMMIGDVTICFKRHTIDFICEKLNAEAQEGKMIKNLYSYVIKVLGVLDIEQLYLVAYAQSMGIDKSSDFAVSDFLLSKVKTKKVENGLQGISLVYKMNEDILNEERSIDYLCQLQKGTRLNQGTSEEEDCIIVSGDCFFRSQQPFGIDFAEEFYSKVLNWTREKLNNILQ